MNLWASLRPHVKVTRGHGLLESALAAQRASVADGLIDSKFREGLVIDIGCGRYPLFLSHVDFSEKVGLERGLSLERPNKETSPGIHFIETDIELDQALPLKDHCCDVAVMLAVVEHLHDEAIDVLFKEIHRVLKPRGTFILTTPASWTAPVLWVLSRLGLVSKEEIDEHKQAFKRADLESYLSPLFGKDAIRSGYFELFMNIWVRADKFQEALPGPIQGGLVPSEE